MNRDRLKETLRKAEGFAEKPYFDVSQFSAGFGHRLPESWPVAERGAAETMLVDKETAEDWLEEDISIAVNDVQSLMPVWCEADDVRQEALVEMGFNLGKSRLSKFKRMIAAVNKQDWKEAAFEARNSNWFRQVKGRARRIALAIETGIIQG